MKSLRGLSIVSMAAAAAGLGMIFFYAPTDDFQGVVQRIFYIHVPSAWIAYLAYAVVLLGSIAHLKTRSTRWDRIAHSSAEVGVVFTVVTLITGMLWGRPVWGTYWVWDPRLTLTFVLFLIYLGYLVFRRMSSDSESSSAVSAVIGVAGFVTVPLVHFSVLWWRGQHPGPVVVDPEGSNLPGQMLATLVWMVLVFTLLYGVFLVKRFRIFELEDRARMEAGA